MKSGTHTGPCLESGTLSGIWVPDWDVSQMTTKVRISMPKDVLTAWKNYLLTQTRYRKSKDISVISVQNIVTSKHATYLEFPPLGFEPRFGFGPFTKD